MTCFSDIFIGICMLLYILHSGIFLCGIQVYYGRAAANRTHICERSWNLHQGMVQWFCDTVNVISALYIRHCLYCLALLKAFIAFCSWITLCSDEWLLWLLFACSVTWATWWTAVDSCQWELPAVRMSYLATLSRFTSFIKSQSIFGGIFSQIHPLW